MSAELSHKIVFYQTIAGNPVLSCRFCRIHVICHSYVIIYFPFRRDLDKICFLTVYDRTIWSVVTTHGA